MTGGRHRGRVRGTKPWGYAIEASKGQSVKQHIVSEFRKAAALLGRHAGFVNSYRATDTGRRIVEIVEMAERGPDAGRFKQWFSVLFGTPLSRLALGVCTAILAVDTAQTASGFQGFEGVGLRDVAVAVALAVFTATLSRLLVDRFRREQEDLEDVLGHVYAFKDDAIKFAAILEGKEGTAKDIVDSRLLDLAFKVVVAENPSYQPGPFFRFVGDSSDAEVFRRRLYSEHSLAKRFSLGKGLQGYFDKAKVIWANTRLAQS